MEKQEYTPSDLPKSMLPHNGEVVEVTRKKAKAEPLPPYNIVGNGFSSRHGTSLDLIDTCAKLNTAEINLLQFFRDEFTHNSIIKEELPNLIIPTHSENFTKYLSIALKKNYSHMEYQLVVRRVKRGTYMVNPDLLMPSRNYLLAKAEWNNLKKDDDDLQI